jgi:signal transduction histidine kinase
MWLTGQWRAIDDRHKVAPPALSPALTEGGRLPWTESMEQASPNMRARAQPPAGATQGQTIRALPLSPASNLLRGLTLGRVGLVLAICAIFTARQQSSCLFQMGCALPDGGTLVGFSTFLARQFAFALPMLLVVTVADNATAHTKQWMRVLALSLAVVFGALVYGLAFFHTQPPNVHKAASGREAMFVFSYGSRALLYGGLAMAMLYFFVREREDARALHAARLEKLSLDRQTIEAHLQALQAQIEPHFLFNTLANIKMLYETEPSRARPLIHDLAAYLRTALPTMRDIRSTLARELELAQAYLRVLKVRMGERLDVIVDVPVELLDATLPPMMLLTLVENAIKHGLGPLPDGGSIAIRAERSRGGLHVSVSDNGVGFTKGFGTGVGLANTRARLTALYGAAGRLSLETNPDGGVTAQIELPCETPGAELGET